MPVALVAHTVDGSSDGTNLTGTAIDTRAASLIVLVVSSLAGHTVVPTDSASNPVWTPLTAQVSTTRVQLYYCVNPLTSATHTFSASQSGGRPSIAVLAFSGGTLPFDLQNGATGSTPLSTGTLTPSKVNALIVAGAGTPSSSAIASIDGGFTLRDSIGVSGTNHEGVASAYLIQTSIAAANPAFTGNTVDTAVIASFSFGFSGSMFTVF